MTKTAKRIHILKTQLATTKKARDAWKAKYFNLRDCLNATLDDVLKGRFRPCRRVKS